MDQPEHHRMALEMNRKEVGKRGPGCGQGLRADLCVSPGVSLAGGLKRTLGSSTKTAGPGSTELGKVCAALASLMGQFGLQPRLFQEFRGPLSQRFEEGSGFCIPGRIKPEG